MLDFVSRSKYDVAYACTQQCHFNYLFSRIYGDACEHCELEIQQKLTCINSIIFPSKPKRRKKNATTLYGCYRRLVAQFQSPHFWCGCVLIELFKMFRRIKHSWDSDISAAIHSWKCLQCNHALKYCGWHFFSSFGSSMVCHFCGCSDKLVQNSCATQN